jgi:hypothetical protein
MKINFENKFKNIETDLVIWFYCIDCYVISFGNSILVGNEKIFLFLFQFLIFICIAVRRQFGQMVTDKTFWAKLYLKQFLMSVIEIINLQIVQSEER